MIIKSILFIFILMIINFLMNIGKKVSDNQQTNDKISLPNYPKLKGKTDLFA